MISLTAMNLEGLDADLRERSKVSHLSCSLDFKGGIISGIIYGTAIGIIKGIETVAFLCFLGLRALI